MKVKEESEKVGLKVNIQKTKIMASGPRRYRVNDCFLHLNGLMLMELRVKNLNNCFFMVVNVTTETSRIICLKK